MATEACTSSPISTRGMNISLITPSAVSQRVAGAWHPPVRKSLCLSRFSLIHLFPFISYPPFPPVIFGAMNRSQLYYSLTNQQETTKSWRLGLGGSCRAAMHCCCLARYVNISQSLSAFVFFCLLVAFAKTSITFTIAQTWGMWKKNPLVLNFVHMLSSTVCAKCMKSFVFMCGFMTEI